jgi:hypothetical protein
MDLAEIPELRSRVQAPLYNETIPSSWPCRQLALRGLVLPTMPLRIRSGVNHFSTMLISSPCKMPGGVRWSISYPRNPMKFSVIRTSRLISNKRGRIGNNAPAHVSRKK